MFGLPEALTGEARAEPMRRFKRILYVFEDEPEHNASLDRAADLARRNGAVLTLAHLVEEPDSMGSGECTRRVTDKLYRTILDEAESELREIARSLGPERPEVRCKVLTGRPHVAVVREVLREGHDLVMKTASPDDSLMTHIFGTLDTRIIELCPCPVWIDKPIPHTRYSRIMAAVDLFADSAPELEVTILELAASIAEIEHAELHVIHVWQLYGETALRGRAFTKAAEEEVAAMIAEERERHAAALEALVEPFRERPLQIEVHLVKGRPELTIAEEAERLEIDLIVIGTHAQSHLWGLLLGSTTQSVLRQAKCAVLAIKPPGFKSPITLDD